ncbi:MAG: hypothetical protein AAGU74_02435 [Bacillota bacterium]
MKTRMKPKTAGKVLSLLVATLILTLLPVTALAAGEVCEIVGGLQYMTLDEALAAAADGDTIRLLADIDHISTISISGMSVTFDLNGHALNVNAASGLGLNASGGATVSLTGAGSFNVTGDHSGVYAAQGSTVTVTSATATGDHGVRAMDGSVVTVRNNVQSNGNGVLVQNSAIVSVGGNISAGNFGVLIEGGGEVYVEGSITAGTYARVNSADKDGSYASRTIPTLLAGYNTYSDGSGVLYVKIRPLAVVTGAVTDITAIGVTLNGEVTGDDGLSIDERGFVWGTSANPEIGGAGVTQVAVGSGLGTFSSALTGLTAGMTYHVRAYAIAASLAGGPPLTVYGEDVGFTLRDDDEPAPIPTPTPTPTPDDFNDIPRTGDGGGFPAWPGIAGLVLLTVGGLLFVLNRKKGIM